MDEDHTASAEGLIDKTADRGHPDKKIFVMRILNGDTHVPNTRLRVLSRDGFGANGDNMCDATLCQRAGRLCRNKAKESYEIRVHDGIQKKEITDFPKKSLPSMMALTFLKPI